MIRDEKALALFDAIQGVRRWLYADPENEIKARGTGATMLALHMDDGMRIARKELGADGRAWRRETAEPSRLEWTAVLQHLAAMPSNEDPALSRLDEILSSPGAAAADPSAGARLFGIHAEPEFARRFVGAFAHASHEGVPANAVVMTINDFLQGRWPRSWDGRDPVEWRCKAKFLLDGLWSFGTFLGDDRRSIYMDYGCGIPLERLSAIFGDRAAVVLLPRPYERPARP